MEVKLGNIFESKCSAIVNPINCVGVMGKGLALEYKKRYPEMFNDYVEKCNYKKVVVGHPYVFKESSGTAIINFPTKNHWRSPSSLSYIIDGLDWFVKNYKKYEITSVAFPALGCGNGGLDWSVVGPLMYQKLNKLPIDIEIYAPYGTPVSMISNVYLLQDFKSTKFSRSNVWFLLLKIVQELNKGTFTTKVGRVMFQKICYVLTRCGVATGFVFDKGLYGPYCSSIKECLTSLAKANLVSEKPMGSMLMLSVSKEVEVSEKDFSHSDWSAMLKTLDLFERIKSTEQAEIVATVIYSYDELAKSKQEVLDSDVYSYVLQWKPHWKNKTYEVCEAISNMNMFAFIDAKYTGTLLETEFLF